MNITEKSKKMKSPRTSSIVTAVLLAAAAFTITGCAPDVVIPNYNVHLNLAGNCVTDVGTVVNQNVCYGSGGGYYGGAHYVYMPLYNAPYYTYGHPGYMYAPRPWVSRPYVSSYRSYSTTYSSRPSTPVEGTVRGTFGSSASSFSSGAGE